MSFAEGFDIGYLKVLAEQGEDVFLSVTPHLRHGPGIQRDGITAPRMTDPHTVPFVMGNRLPLSEREHPQTTNSYVQRAGTWTLFEHVQRFHEKHGQEYRIVGVQSCGDLTMNPWHVAFCWETEKPVLYHLAVAGDPTGFAEPIHERIYRCLVKWKAGIFSHLYEFLDLKFSWSERGFEARCVQNDLPAELREKLKDWPTITESIEFALSGKLLVHKGQDISLSSAIDQFQDVRHIFNVPEVAVHDTTGSPKGTIYFGEHVLFHDLNARRAALNSPIIVDLRVPKRDLIVRMEDLKETLVNKYHYKVSSDSPTRRGEFRQYSESSVELFYRHNVYPFGVLGGRRGALVCLSSGGLSGRVGNTLEGVIRVMFDFFGCEDALVLDEGFDTFHILNPNPKKKENDPDQYKYDNIELLNQVAAFTAWRMSLDQDECQESESAKSSLDKYRLGDNPWKWPLNVEVSRYVRDYCSKEKIDPRPSSSLDAMAVEPRRSQMRAVLIFARRRKTGDAPDQIVSRRSNQ